MKKLLSIFVGAIIAVYIIISYEIGNQNVAVVITITSLIIGTIIINKIDKKIKTHIRVNYNEYGKKEADIKNKLNEIKYKIEQLEITIKNTKLITDEEFKNTLIKKQNEFLEYLVGYFHKYIKQWFMIRVKEIFILEHLDSNEEDYNEENIANSKRLIEKIIEEIESELNEYDITKVIAEEKKNAMDYINDKIKQIVAKRTSDIISTDSPVEREYAEMHEHDNPFKENPIVDLDELNKQFDIFMSQKELS